MKKLIIFLFLFFWLGITQSNATVPQTGLVGEWLLDGNSLDTGPYGLNGSDINISYILSDSGVLDNAYFNGTNSRINFPTSSYLTPTTSVTWSFLYKGHSTGGPLEALFSNGNSTPDGFVNYVDNASGKLALSVYGGGGAVYYCYGTKNINDGFSHLVTISYDSSVGYVIYIDGLNDPTSSCGGALINISYTANGMMLGSNYTVYYGEIQLGLFRMYNRALSTIEFTELYNDYLNVGPPPLEFTATGEILPIQNGFTLSGSIINQDYNITNIDIFKYEAGSPFLLDDDYRLVNITGSGGVEVSLDILNDSDFTFSSFNDYEIKITFKSIDGLQSMYNYYTYGIYVYNQGYIEPDPNTFYYSLTQFYSFENGFFYNSIPEPYGGEFYFELIAPNPSGTGTINVTTEKYGAYETDGNGYGVDGGIKVTFPYHPISGTYQIRVVYEYDNVIDYPYGTYYDAYEITLAERRLTATELEEELAFLYICDTDLDGITSTGEAIVCPFTVLKYYTSKVYTFFENIYNLLEKIGSAFTTEVKTFSFVGSANAESNEIMTGFNNSVDQTAYDETFFGKLTIFINGFLAFMVFLIGILVYLSLTRKKG